MAQTLCECGHYLTEYETGFEHNLKNQHGDCSGQIRNGNIIGRCDCENPRPKKTICQDCNKKALKTYLKPNGNRICEKCLFLEKEERIEVILFCHSCKLSVQCNPTKKDMEQIIEYETISCCEECYLSSGHEHRKNCKRKLTLPIYIAK